ncbi:hypothetical protein E2C01_075048 [Portunus trituberculatus]|uniref:Uncharacterized protein n=1 Tax=Portunus trituberculatus TaxID=210409 RepID=A0A5B7IFV8_PORTR|nr:hypothetical protein [Portunus trituberculatus]
MEGGARLQSREQDGALTPRFPLRHTTTMHTARASSRSRLLRRVTRAVGRRAKSSGTLSCNRNEIA